MDERRPDKPLNQYFQCWVRSSPDVCPRYKAVVGSNSVNSVHHFKEVAVMEGTKSGEMLPIRHKQISM